MNANEIRERCSALLKKTSLYSEKYSSKLCAAFELRKSDMRLNYEFFGDKARVFCYERGDLVCEYSADETQVTFLVLEGVLYGVVMEIVTREENLIKRGERKYIDTELTNSFMNKVFEEIGGIYDELYKQRFDIFKLGSWNGG